MIPKGDGGSRPLSIAAICWRMFATTIARQLTPATSHWPYELTGGIGGRDLGDAHQQIMHALRTARRRGWQAHVVAQDLAKAFDKVSFVQAAAAMGAAGIDA